VRKPVWLLAPALLLGACASDKYLGSPAHAPFDRGDWAIAERGFEQASKEPGANQLLFMLDWGMALFEQGKYAEAAKIFLKAEKLAEIKDYTSVSEEIGTLATSDNVRGYKGEDFEKVLINVYLAFCFAAQGQTEEAQVEARKINLLLNRMITEGKRNYEESPFARVFSSMLWEASGDWNAAYIDLKLAHKLDPSFPGLGEGLITLSNKLGFGDDERRWREAYPEAQARRIKKGEGELVVFFELGKSPRKVPRSENSSLPRFESRYFSERGLEVQVKGLDPVRTASALNIEGTSTRYLEDRIGRMAGKKMLGTLAKGAIAAGVGSKTDNSDVGWLVFYALMATDRADLRSWMSLPAEIQMARIPLMAGDYDVKLRVLDSSGGTLRELPDRKVSIKGGAKAFVIAR